jgi:hypothetical protein
MGSPSVIAPRHRRPRDSRSLGRGSDHRGSEYAPGYSGGTAVALHDASEGARKRHGQRRDGVVHTDPTPPRRIASVAHQGSRDGIDPAQTINTCDQGGRLFFVIRKVLCSEANTNRLLRQYFPKGTTLSQYSQADLDRIALRMNQRPRKTLGFQTPAAIFGDQCCAHRLNLPWLCLRCRSPSVPRPSPSAHSSSPCASTHSP